MSISFKVSSTINLKNKKLSKAAKKFGILPYPELNYNNKIFRKTYPLYKKVKNIISMAEWSVHAPYIYAINKLKKQRNAVILAHNYMVPEIFHCVSDFTGDSLELAIKATKCDAEIIIQGGVYFMAETSKILAPKKTILIPDKKAGCSLASSITTNDIAILRSKYPGVPIISYVNTSADVKAAADICCTSSNVLDIIESFNTKSVICIPDEHLANNISKKTNINIITFKGYCEVHDQFTAEELNEYREQYSDLTIIAHPECPPSVIDVADFSGSTKSMIDFVKNNRPKKVMMVTECSMSDNVAAEIKDNITTFIRPCNICPHMKRITLKGILNSLVYLENEVEINPIVAIKAKKSIQKMLNINKNNNLQ